VCVFVCVCVCVHACGCVRACAFVCARVLRTMVPCVFVNMCERV